jgi:hypothetical protein
VTVRILAIDPGPAESAYVLIDADSRQPIRCGKHTNSDISELLPTMRGIYSWTGGIDTVAIEMIASYGMAVGREVFDTCVWIGRFFERARRLELSPELVYRQNVKLHHCHSAKAKDANITQALIDRFAPGVPNRGKGTKAEPGWFYGFRADIWQSYALAVYVADMKAPTVDCDRGSSCSHS